MSWPTIEAKKAYNRKWMRDHWVMTRERKDRANQLRSISYRAKKSYYKVCGFCQKDFIGYEINKFCSRACGSKFRIYAKAKGFMIDSCGYKMLHLPDHPNAEKDGWVKEHRKVMSDYIGRPLVKNEIVHHIDEDRLNNDIANLQLMTRGEHTALHKRLKGRINNV